MLLGFTGFVCVVPERQGENSSVLNITDTRYISQQKIFLFLKDKGLNNLRSRGYIKTNTGVISKALGKEPKPPAQQQELVMTYQEKRNSHDTIWIPINSSWLFGPMATEDTQVKCPPTVKEEWCRQVTVTQIGLFGDIISFSFYIFMTHFLDSSLASLPSIISPPPVKATKGPLPYT